jgi:hypothetical protein
MNAETGPDTGIRRTASTPGAVRGHAEGHVGFVYRAQYVYSFT